MVCKLCGANFSGNRCINCGLPFDASPIMTPLSFGKYSGRTVEQVYSNDPTYLQWMIGQGVGTPAQRAKATLLLLQKKIQGSQNDSITLNTGYIIIFIVILVIVGGVIWANNQPTTNNSSRTIPAQVATATPAAYAESYPCSNGQIKGNKNSGIYHVPGQQYYSITHVNVQCFDTEAQAQAAGFRKSKV